jgi:hypothetical protein
MRQQEDLRPSPSDAPPDLDDDEVAALYDEQAGHDEAEHDERAEDEAYEMAVEEAAPAPAPRARATVEEEDDDAAGPEAEALAADCEHRLREQQRTSRGAVPLGKNSERDQLLALAAASWAPGSVGEAAMAGALGAIDDFYVPPAAASHLAEEEDDATEAAAALFRRRYHAMVPRLRHETTLLGILGFPAPADGAYPAAPAAVDEAAIARACDEIDLLCRPAFHAAVGDARIGGGTAGATRVDAHAAFRNRAARMREEMERDPAGGRAPRAAYAFPRGALNTTTKIEQEAAKWHKREERAAARAAKEAREARAPRGLTPEQTQQLCDLLRPANVAATYKAHYADQPIEAWRRPPTYVGTSRHGGGKINTCTPLCARRPRRDCAG